MSQIQDQTQELTGQASRGSATILPIEKRNAKGLPYESFLKEYVTPNRPVVIQDAAPHWNAMQNWTPEFFKSHFGSQTVDVTYGVQMQLAEVIDAVLASTAEQPGPYLHKVIIHQHMPDLLPDLSPENVYAFPRRYCSPLMPKRFQRPDGYLKLLIGGVGGKFPLMHFDSDNAHAVITEIYGDKEFVLFSPEDSPCVYPHAGSPGTSQIDDLDHPDLEKFPLFAKATQYRTIIQPGESIFVPSRWWHSARVVSTSISVCTNMMHGSNWQGFISESCKIAKEPSRSVKRLYLNVAGTIMSAAEGLQSKFPQAGFARSLSRLSPNYPSGAATSENRNHAH